MTVDLRDIPPAPRAVRWSTVIWQRWVLLLGGGLLAGFGGLVALLLWVADHGSHVATAENDLDHGGARAAGRVVAVEHAQAWDGTERDVVGYEFTTPDGTDAHELATVSSTATLRDALDVVLGGPSPTVTVSWLCVSTVMPLIGFPLRRWTLRGGRRSPSPPSRWRCCSPVRSSTS